MISDDKFGSVLKCIGKPKVATGGGEWAWPPPSRSLITPQAQREQGKVIGCGVHIYIFITYLPRLLYIFLWRVA